MGGDLGPRPRRYSPSGVFLGFFFKWGLVRNKWGLVLADRSPPLPGRAAGGGALLSRCAPLALSQSPYGLFNSSSFFFLAIVFPFFFLVITSFLPNFPEIPHNFRFCHLPDFPHWPVRTANNTAVTRGGVDFLSASSYCCVNYI